MENNNIRRGYLARAKNRKIGIFSKEKMESQLQNCFEVIRKYEEKINISSNTNPKLNPDCSSRSVRTGHQRPMSGRRKDDMLRPTDFGKKQQIEKKKNKVQRTVSSMLGDIKNLTPEERNRAGGMLDVLEQEQNKEHNRGHNRGRGR